MVCHFFPLRLVSCRVSPVSPKWHPLGPRNQLTRSWSLTPVGTGRHWSHEKIDLFFTQTWSPGNGKCQFLQGLVDDQVMLYDYKISYHDYYANVP
jgi:hypothetical protein